MSPLSLLCILPENRSNSTVIIHVHHNNSITSSVEWNEISSHYDLFTWYMAKNIPVAYTSTIFRRCSFNLLLQKVLINRNNILSSKQNWLYSFRILHLSDADNFIKTLVKNSRVYLIRWSSYSKEEAFWELRSADFILSLMGLLDMKKNKAEKYHHNTSLPFWHFHFVGIIIKWPQWCNKNVSEII